MTNSAISFLAWALYALWIDDAWLLTSSAVGLPGAVATAVAAVRRDPDRAGLRLPALWALILLTAASAQLSGGLRAVSLVVGTSIVWSALPALVRAWRSGDVSGIAAGSWWVLAGEGALFLGYGLTRHLAAPTAYGVVCLLGASGVLARLALGSPRLRLALR